MGRQYRDIVVRGVSYPSVQACAEALGVTGRAVYTAISRGRLDGLGLNDPWRDRPRKSVCVRGVTYPTVRACAEALGVSVGTVNEAVRRGAADGIGLGRGRRPRMPVRVRGVVYEDMTAAAAALGVCEGTVRRAINMGAVDQLGLPGRKRRRHGPPKNSRPVVIGGARFPSMSAASRALGFSESYVSSVLRRGSDRQRERLIGAAMAWVARQGRAA